MKIKRQRRGLGFRLATWLSIIGAGLVGTSAVAAEPIGDRAPRPVSGGELVQIPHVSASETDTMAQINSVFQLRDVSPGDWAFEALRNLVERYGCLAGYPDGTFRGDRPISRYEFAAGLNACLQAIEQILVSGEGRSTRSIANSDLETLERLAQMFGDELSVLETRLDNLEIRTSALEASQFSPTAILIGNAVFTLAGAEGDDIDVNPVIFSRARVQLIASFSGKDSLFVRLTSGNVGNSFQDETGTREGRFAFDRPSGNIFELDRLQYTFPVGDRARLVLMPVLGAHHFYNEVFNSGLNPGGGATGSLSRFSQRPPIYRLGAGLGTAGLGFRYRFSNSIEFSAGYLAPNGADAEQGLFDDRFSALGQLAISPSDRFKFGLTYVRGYESSERPGTLLWAGTGTNLANLRGVVPAVPVNSDTFGAQFEWDIASQISLRGWFGYSDLELIGEGDGEILYYAGILVFRDLGKEGNLGAIIVGAEPYLADLDIGGDPTFSDDIPWHVEAFYKHQINRNISLTPGIIWLLAPNQDSDNNDIVIGALRLSFTF